MAFLVIDIGEEVAFHVGNHSQVQRAVKPLTRHGCLTNDGDRVGQMLIDERIGGRRTIVRDHAAELLRSRPVLGIEDEIDRARMRIKQDDRLGDGHVILLMWHRQTQSSRWVLFGPRPGERAAIGSRTAPHEHALVRKPIPR